MSLLDIAQAISDQVGIKEISSVINNSGDNERQIHRLIQSGGRALCQKTNSNGDGWSVLTRIHEFTTVDAEPEYNLPSDFKKFVVNTAWQKDKYWRMRGSLSGQRWEQIRNRQSSQSYNVFRIFRTQNSVGAQVQDDSAPNTIRKFHIEPAPGAGIDIVYEYVSEAYWISEDGTTFKRTPDADSDESLFGDEMHILDGIWRFKAAKGYNFSTDLALFEDYRDTAMAQDMAQENPIPVGYRDTGRYANWTESDVGWCP